MNINYLIELYLNNIFGNNFYPRCISYTKYTSYGVLAWEA